MATTTVSSLAYALSPTIAGNPVGAGGYLSANMVPTGNADGGICLATESDGKYLITSDNAGSTFAVTFAVPLAIPDNATINNVQLLVNHSIVPNGGSSPIDVSALLTLVSSGQTSGIAFLEGSLLSSTSLVEWHSAVMTTNPATGAAWTKATLYTGADPFFNPGSGFVCNVVPIDANYKIDYITFLVNYTAGSSLPVTSAAVTPVVGSTLGGD